MSYSRTTALVIAVLSSAALLMAATPTQTQDDSSAFMIGPDSPVLGADGKAVYMKKCKKCHGADGKAGTKMGKKYEMKPIPGKLSKGKVKKVINNGKPNTKMKSFSKKLSPEEIDAVTAYVMTL